MAETAAGLREQAHNLRASAQRADSLDAYDKDMRQADDLDEQARRLEAAATKSKPKAKRVDRRRNAQLAKIHIARQQLGMDEETYRAMLQRIAGVTSAKALTPTGIGRVLEHLRSIGFKDKNARRPNPHISREAQIGKIEALLADAGRPWGYADAIAKRVCQIDAVAFCNGDQLQKIIAALAIDQRRRKAR
ncbi:gp16 family protein [Acidihalobacter prosperus]|uniref:Phage protein n=1 Tax=Acidihalobacter prosperus TaxID=160660 RepID=A0A1A6C8B4_9GAMM|nr:regulatory protein GemA [Acidihalobacter prosperus]OBS10808.1 Phage protein [Acidihalobacter prosperus]